MNHRRYTPDNPIREQADQLQTLRDNNHIDAFANALLDMGYVSDDQTVPDYRPVLETLQDVRATLTTAVNGEETIEYEGLQTRLDSRATDLSDLACHPGISGEVATMLRSLAADVQRVADATIPQDSAIDLLEGIANTVEDIHTIFAVLHDANQYLAHNEYADPCVDDPSSQTL